MQAGGIHKDTSVTQLPMEKSSTKLKLTELSERKQGGWLLVFRFLHDAFFSRRLA